MTHGRGLSRLNYVFMLQDPFVTMPPKSNILVAADELDADMKAFGVLFERNKNWVGLALFTFSQGVVWVLLKVGVQTVAMEDAMLAGVQMLLDVLKPQQSYKQRLLQCRVEVSGAMYAQLRLHVQRHSQAHVLWYCKSALGRCGAIACMIRCTSSCTWHMACSMDMNVSWDTHRTHQSIGHF